MAGLEGGAREETAEGGGLGETSFTSRPRDKSCIPATATAKRTNTATRSQFLPPLLASIPVLPSSKGAHSERARTMASSKPSKEERYSLRSLLSWLTKASNCSRL